MDRSTTPGSNPEVRIGGRPVGTGRPCYLVAEIGINHNGDMQLARQMMDAARQAGADAVKFQNYRTEDFLSPDSPLIHEYESRGQKRVEPQYAMFRRYELSDSDLKGLADYAKKTGIDFHSTPTNAEGVDLLVQLGVGVLKNGSDYLTNLPLIRKMGETGLPTVLSLGMSTVAEIDEAVRTFRGTGNQQLILLHCTSSYPTPASDVNLRRLPVLGQAFGCPVGFSDHTHGYVAAAVAAGFGACWVEKHFTLDKSLEGPDHAFSADPAEFASLVHAVREVEVMLGESAIGPARSESAGRVGFRLSCCARRALSKGASVTLEDLKFQRPGDGIPPAHAYLLAGRKLIRDVAEGHVFRLEDFQ